MSPESGVIMRARDLALAFGTTHALRDVDLFFLSFHPPPFFFTIVFQLRNQYNVGP